MPIYEYVCPECQHVFEELVSLGDESAKPCPKCGKAKAQRKPSTFAAGHSAPGSTSCAPRRG